MTASVRPQALFFDLFGTVVHFAPRVPTVEVAGTRWRSTMNWLRETAERELPEVSFDQILATLMQVTEELVRQRPPQYFEVPSRERFRRALARLGVEAQRAPALAERLSLAHMAHLASMTLVPPEDARLLRQLAARYRLGLISNFDHAPTARRILSEHNIADLFDPIVISDEFGRRKPHPEIFAAALGCMGLSNTQALFVGDSVSDDLIGAHNVHLPFVWLNVKSEALPPGTPPPDHVIAQLTDLPALLGEPPSQ